MGGGEEGGGRYGEGMHSIDTYFGGANLKKNVFMLYLSTISPLQLYRQNIG